MSETAHGHAELVGLKPAPPHDVYGPFIPLARAIVHEYLEEWDDVRAETNNTDVWSTAEDMLRIRIASAIALATPIAAPGGAVTVDALAQEIRRVDGNHNLGAGALAEALMPFLAALRPEAAGQGEASLSCDEQFALATRLAADLGYTLVEEPSHPDTPIDNFSTPRPAPVAPDIVEAQFPYAVREEDDGTLTPLFDPPVNLAALSSELAEAKRERDDAIAIGHAALDDVRTYRTRAEAAEAEVARLNRELESVRTNSELLLARLIEANDALDEFRVEVARLKDENKELVAALDDIAQVTKSGTIIGRIARRSLTAAKGG